MKKRIVLVVLMAVVLFSSIVVAAPPVEKPQTQCTDDQIIYATGDVKGTYSMMTQGLKKVSGGLICEWYETSGGFDNVNLLLERKIDAGLVQVDVMDWMKRSDERVAKKLRSIASLHSNVAHIIINRSGFVIQEKGRFFGTNQKKVVANNLRDLKGTTVALFGSGFITGRLISEKLNLDLKFIEVEKKEQGLEMLKSGQVSAMIAMGGIPISWVEKLDKNVYALANVDASDINGLQKPYFAVKMNYRTLGIMGANAIAVKNEVIVWNYTSGDGAQRINKLRNILHSNLTNIKEARGSHPAWQEVEDLDDLYWTGYGGSTPKENPSSSHASKKKRRGDD